MIDDEKQVVEKTRQDLRIQEENGTLCCKLPESPYSGGWYNMAIQLQFPQMVCDDNVTASCDEHKQDLFQSCWVDKSLSEKKFIRLVERILVGGVVPFLGAGLSLQSLGPNNDTIASTQKMICSVCRKLPRNNLDKRCLRGRKKCCGKPKLRCGQRRRLADVCEEYLWEVGQLEDLVYNILQIQNFTRLEITDAHKYIAYLARESVIEEVITSNYDTSLERAYSESVRSECLENESLGLEFSVSCLHEYRMIAGEKREEPFPLKVYHVNGCAWDLQGDSNERAQACETILLTERQLQDWGRRQWGRDLLRDRLRCKNIVFSGFGSPEPQVRHTLLQVLEEFELDKNAQFQNTNDQSQNDAQGWEAPNAVFIHAYDDLTFEQRQVLSAYAAASYMDTKIQSIIESGNCFTRGDTPLLLEDQSGNFPADEFWKCIYKAVLWRLLNRYWLSYGSPFFYLLRSSVSCADVLLDRVRQWLLPELDSQTQTERLFGRFPKYLDIEDNSLLLSAYIWHVRHRGLPLTGGWYAPVSEKGIIISSYFILVYLLGLLNKQGQGYSSWDELLEITKTSKSFGLGLEFRLLDNSKDKGLLLLAHGESLFQPGERISGGLADYKIIVQAVIDDEFRPTRVRVQSVENSAGSTDGITHIRYISVYQMAFSDLLGRDSSKVTNIAELVESVRTRLLYPNTVLSSSQRGVRNRGHIRRNLDGTGDT